MTIFPKVIIRLVWEFAYMKVFLCDPMRDLAYIARVQASVPPMIFEERIALSEEIDRQWLHTDEFLYRSAFSPNPFIRGNPYLPMDMLAIQCLFNRNLEVITSMFSRDLIRHLRTYRGIIFRYVNKTLLTMTQWNALFIRFLRHRAVRNPENYMCFSPIERHFVKMWCTQLEDANTVSQP
jgi:hypothetical protein